MREQIFRTIVEEKEFFCAIKGQSNLCVLGESIFCKIYLNNGKYFLTCLSKSSTQGFDQFDSFSSNVSLTFSNIYVERSACSILTSCFNGRYANRWLNNEINSARIEIDDISLLSGCFN